MTEPDTQLVPKTADESRFGSLSVRAVIALLLVTCVCLVCTYGAIESKDFEVHEPMYSLVMVAMGFFFGQKTTKTL